MLRTPLCDLLGIDVPVFNAGMGGGGAGPELAAAVSNAGGLGVLGMGGVPPDVIREAIRATRSLTDRPFGVNIILALLEEGQIEVCLEERVPVLILFWGDVAPFVARAHAAGVKVIPQVGSVEEARQAAAAGVDAVMAQGVEAGGHVRGTVALSTILPAVVEAVRPLPVIAAGGIANGAGLAAALDLGAQAVSLGTRFLCSNESSVTREYKERVAAARAEDTVYTKLFDVGWPDAAHRVLHNRAIAEWENAGRPPSGKRPGEGTIVGRLPLPGDAGELPRYSVMPPIQGFEGDMEYTALYAGQSCSLVHDIRPAAAIVRDLVREAEETRARR